MKSVKMEIDGWMGTVVETFSGESWGEVLGKFNDFQDLECLLRQVDMMGTAADQQGSAAFRECAEKWLYGQIAKEDFAGFRVALSIGHLCCLSAADEAGELVFPAWGEAKKPAAKSKVEKSAKPRTRKTRAV